MKVKGKMDPKVMAKFGIAVDTDEKSESDRYEPLSSRPPKPKPLSAVNNSRSSKGFGASNKS